MNHPTRLASAAILLSTSLAAAQPIPPMNDSCEGAIQLNANESVTGTLELATGGGSLGCTPTGRDVWFAVTPPQSGLLAINTCGSACDTVLDLLEGVCGTLVPITCNDSVPPLGPCPPGVASALAAPVVAGQTYYIRLGAPFDGPDAFQLNLHLGPANDACEFAQPIVPGMSYTLDNTTADTNLGAGCFPLITSLDVWYTYTPTSSHQLVLDTIGSGFDTVLSFREGGCGWTPWAICNDDAMPGVDYSFISTPVIAGHTYNIHLCAVNGHWGAGVLNVSALQPNDSCATATEISLGTHQGDTSFATRDGVSACNPSGTSGDVWYRWTATCTGDLFIDTCGSPLDTVVTAYSGPCGERLTQLACNDDSDEGPCADEAYSSFLTIPVVAGATYQIAVRGYNDSSGPFTLRLRQNANESCANAIPISIGTTSFDTTCAQFVPGPECDETSGTPVLWYAFTATCTGAALAETCGSTFPTVIGLAHNCGDAEAVACAGHGSLPSTCPNDPNSAALLFDTVAGQTYLLSVCGDGSAVGVGRLTLSCRPPTCSCDWNESGALNSQDFFDFLASFFAGRADFNSDAATNSQDFFDFLACFFAGC